MTDQASQELKACPFCGSNDVQIIRFEHVPGAPSWEAHCLSCTVCNSEASEAEAIAAWNTRTPPVVDEDVRQKVARAICAAQYPDELPFDDLSLETQAEYLRAADAAIAALSTEERRTVEGECSSDKCVYDYIGPHEAGPNCPTATSDKDAALIAELREALDEARSRLVRLGDDGNCTWDALSKVGEGGEEEGQ